MTDRTSAAADGPAETAVEHVIRAIRDAIREGRLEQGQRLVVAGLGQQFGVSAGPVREALRRLAGEGTVEFTPHRGAVVRIITERDIRETFQVREAIEGYAARLAAENIHRSEYAERLEGCRGALHATLGDITEHTRERQRFHDLLYEFSGNAMLRETAERLTSPLYRLRFNRLVGPERTRQSLREHDDLIDAILSGSGATAERCMRQHLRNSAEAICEIVEALPAAQAGGKKRS